MTTVWSRRSTESLPSITLTFVNASVHCA
jgi:hypothetical protein